MNMQLQQAAQQQARIAKYDDCVRDADRALIYDFLAQPGWGFGWKSDPMTDRYSFFHKHFAGMISPDHYESSNIGSQPDCSEELGRNAPLLLGFWRALNSTVMKGHRLVRCYANGQTYGSEGTVHTDSVAANSYTLIYYPHEIWTPNWGGETVFLDEMRSDILASIYPKPNRLISFPGRIPHVARGVTRSCPLMRITLMFKTEMQDL